MLFTREVRKVEDVDVDVTFELIPETDSDKLLLKELVKLENRFTTGPVDAWFDPTARGVKIQVFPK